MANFFANLLGFGNGQNLSITNQGGGASSTSSSPQKLAPSYSFAELQKLYNKLSQFRESDLEKAGGSDVVETVRQITEALIWGEQNDTNFFDFFCEKSILADFIRVLGLAQAPKKVKVQLLQTLSILVQNIRRQTSLYYLLSGNYVNRLIMIPLDFNDEEILAYYITLLKSLAMRLDSETIKFFFIQHQTTTFPLYSEASKFFDHKDQMVRAAVRTITLQVYKVDDPAMQRYVLRHAKDTYFHQLTSHLRELWILFNAACQSEEGYATLQHRDDLQQDLLIYLSDVFDLRVTELNAVLAKRLLNGVMLTMLLPSITYGKGDGSSSTNATESGNDSTARLQPAVALFLIRQVFDTFRSSELIDPMISALLLENAPYATVALYPSYVHRFPSAQHIDGGVVPNALQEHFTTCLKSAEDSVFVLAAGILQRCLYSSRALSAEFLEQARLLPGVDDPATAPDLPKTDQAAKKGFSVSWPRKWSRNSNKSPATSPSKQPYPSSAEPEVGGSRIEIGEVLSFLVQGFQRHASMPFDSFQIFVRIMLDICLHPAIFHHEDSYSIVRESLQDAIRSAAQVLRLQMQGVPASQIVVGPNGDVDNRSRALVDETASMPDDSLLDLLLEEWELHVLAPASVSDMCSNPKIFLGPVAVKTARRSGNAVLKQGQNAIRNFLLLRRLFIDLHRYASQVSEHPGPNSSTPPSFVNASIDDRLPFQIEGEAECGFSENMNLEVGPLERIVCSLTTSQGKQTRYLVLHEFWLLLVQPDLTTMGWATVKTLWPIRSVQSLIDRSDPRTLCIGMHALRGSSFGEAVMCRSSEPGVALPAEKTSTYLTLTLNFEDVKKCHSADKHLQKRRKDVRAQLMQKAIKFIEEYCSESPSAEAVAKGGNRMQF